MSSRISEFKDLCKEVGVISTGEASSALPPPSEAQCDYKHAGNYTDRNAKFRRAVAAVPKEERLDFAMSALVNLSVLARSDKFPRAERDGNFAKKLKARALLVDLQKVKPVASKGASQSDWIYI